MKSFFALYAVSMCLSLSAAEPAVANADPPAAPSLAQRVQAFDEAFFAAFNRCDLATLESMVAPGLEFFHDLNGVERSRERFLESVKNNVCGKFRREVVAGSIEVWPLGKDGAIYAGTHRFCNAGKTGCQGQGRFLHILEWQSGRAVLARVVSYDHRPIAP